MENLAKLQNSYIVHVWKILSLLRAVKTHDFDLYAVTLQYMSSMFFLVLTCRIMQGI